MEQSVGTECLIIILTKTNSVCMMKVKITLLRDSILHWKDFKNEKQKVMSFHLRISAVLFFAYSANYVIKHWKEDIAIEAKSNHLCLKRALKYWRSWSKQQYRNKNTIKYKNTINAMQTIQLKQSIKHWRHYISSRYQAQKQYIRASAYFSIKQQRQCLLEWNELTQKNITLAMEYDHFMMQKTNKILKTYFNAWKRESKLQQNSMEATVLLNKFANRLRVFNAFHQWKDVQNYRHAQHGIPLPDAVYA